MGTFSTRIVKWQRQHGRHDLPWQNTRDAYRIWLSEIMLQQTQVSAVIPYYQRFLAAFPDIAALADATEDRVMQHWAGLGYYARARNLHRAAKQIVAQHGGLFPNTLDEIVALPGIGRSTAAAIAVFAHAQRAAILDGNVKRVFARHFGVEGDVKSKPVEDRLWSRAEQELPRSGVEAYTQGLMDLGATLCTRTKPACERCPVRATCVARAEGRVDTLPGRSASRELPHRELRMLILIASGEVLLEKRPSPGIWGGLWSLPEVSMRDDVLAAVSERYSVNARVVREHPVVPHGFTHYSLSIYPVELAVSKRAGVRAAAGDERVVWVDVHDARAAAVPAPVKRILSAVAESLVASSRAPTSKDNARGRVRAAKTRN
jgi:A/G-specific adenine glycosylase